MRTALVLDGTRARGAPYFTRIRSVFLYCKIGVSAAVMGQYRFTAATLRCVIGPVPVQTVVTRVCTTPVSSAWWRSEPVPLGLQLTAKRTVCGATVWFRNVQGVLRRFDRFAHYCSVCRKLLAVSEDMCDTAANVGANAFTVRDSRDVTTRRFTDGVMIAELAGIYETAAKLSVCTPYVPALVIRVRPVSSYSRMS
jgi:hypothetical protein